MVHIKPFAFGRYEAGISKFCLLWFHETEGLMDMLRSKISRVSAVNEPDIPWVHEANSNQYRRK